MEKYKYEIKITWDKEDQVYIARITEIEFCTAHGDTYQEALKNIEDALNFWIKISKETGRTIPKPLSEFVSA
jgi:predicted RNase H-like HicB family nuclease